MKRFLLLSALIVPVFMPLESFIEKPASQDIQADTICFSRDILPIFNSNCAMAGCHDATSHKDGLTITSYTGVMRGIKSGSPSTSSFYRQIDLKTMPQYPYLPIPDSLKTRIANWITAGAKNTACAPEANCDTVNVDYLRDIKPILQVNCVGCHQSSLAGGGVHLDNDENNDLLKEAIYNTSAHIGSNPMPKNVGALTSCQVAKIKAWAFPAATSDVATDAIVRDDVHVFSSNPSENIVRFQLTKSADVRIVVYAADGVEVATFPSTRYDVGVNDLRVSTQGWANGLYLVRVVTYGQVRTAKFIR